MKTLPVLLLFSSMLIPRFDAQSQGDRSPLMSVVKAERAFARKSLEVGSRPAFMMFFADEAVVFRPHPVKYKEAMRNVPLPKNPLETTLEWQPIWADVSKNGDLGYTTGPSVWTDHTPAKRPPHYGFYFSFWKKQLTGEWKVVFDIGTELPGPYTGSRALGTPSPTKSRMVPSEGTPRQQRSVLMQVEQDFLSAIKNNGVDKTLGAVLDAEARIYRQKTYPIVGIDSIRAYFSGRPYLSAWEPKHCEVATSGDLGYTYGSYTLESSQGSSAEKGYFLHGWKRDAVNRWKLIAEITSPLPPETPRPKQ